MKGKMFACRNSPRCIIELEQICHAILRGSRGVSYLRRRRGGLGKKEILAKSTKETLTLAGWESMGLPNRPLHAGKNTVTWALSCLVVVVVVFVHAKRKMSGEEMPREEAEREEKGGKKGGERQKFTALPRVGREERRGTSIKGFRLTFRRMALFNR